MADDLHVTPRAAGALKAALAHSPLPYVRIMPGGGGPSGVGFGLALTDAPLPNDVLRERAGVAFCVDSEAWQVMGQVVLDYESDATPPAFVFLPGAA